MKNDKAIVKVMQEINYDRFGNPLGHATCTGGPPTQEEAERTIEFLIEVMERCVERIEKRIMGGER